MRKLHYWHKAEAISPGDFAWMIVGRPLTYSPNAIGGIKLSARCTDEGKAKNSHRLRKPALSPCLVREHSM